MEVLVQKLLEEVTNVLKEEVQDEEMMKQVSRMVVLLIIMLSS